MLGYKHGSLPDQLPVSWFAFEGDTFIYKSNLRNTGQVTTALTCHTGCISNSSFSLSLFLSSLMRRYRVGSLFSVLPGIKTNQTQFPFWKYLSLQSHKQT